MRFSIWPSLQQSWTDIAELVERCERTGWDGAWVADHFMGDDGGFGPATAPNLEATAVLAALACSVPRLRLGSLVLGNAYRHPAVVANWAATVDRISNGRLVLGVGAGWQVNEHQQYGIELAGPRARLDRLEEACRVMIGLLRDAETTFEGTYYRVTGALCEPKPVQPRLPLLIGGKGDRMLHLVAALADEWNMWSLPTVFAERSAVLDHACELIGRDPAGIARSTQALMLVTDDAERARTFVDRAAPRAAVAGTTEHIIDVVGAWRDAGVDELIVPDITLGTGAERTDQLDAIISQVAPQFR